MHHGFEHLERMIIAQDGGDRRGVHHDNRLKKPKVDIPYFDGGRPYDWLDRAKYFFRVYEVPREARVELLAFTWRARQGSGGGGSSLSLSKTAGGSGGQHLSMHFWSNGGLHMWRVLSDR